MSNQNQNKTITAAGVPKSDDVAIGETVYVQSTVGRMVDLETSKDVLGEPSYHKMTGWMQSQVTAGKIEFAKIP